MGITPRQLKRIPLIVVLWERQDFGGRKRTFPIITESLPKDQFSDGISQSFNSLARLDLMEFNDVTTAIGIHEGPTFRADEAFDATISFFEHPNFRGRELVLPPGQVRDLKLWDFAGRISSWRYNPPGTRAAGLYEESGALIGPITLSGPPCALIAPIPLVVQLYNINFGDTNMPIAPSTGYPNGAEVTGNVITLIEDSFSLGADFGQEFDGKANTAVVWMGPDYQIAIHDQDNWHARLEEEPITQADILSGNEPAHRDLSPRQRIHDPSVQVASGVFDDPLKQRIRALRFVMRPVR